LGFRPAARLSRIDDSSSVDKPRTDAAAARELGLVAPLAKLATGRLAV